MLELNDLPEALRSLDACLKAEPSADLLRARAAARARLGQYAGAQADYTRLLEAGADAATHAARGWVGLAAEAPALALADFEEAVRLGGDGEAYAGRGLARVLRGQVRSGLQDVEEALRRGPETPRLAYQAARAYAQAAGRQADGGRPAEDARAVCQERALRLLGRALELLPAGQRAAFWQANVQNDAALNPVRASAGFARLAQAHARQPH